MNEHGLNVVINAMAWLIIIGGSLNVAFFFANLKIYTEIMKEKSQRKRQEESNG